MKIVLMADNRKTELLVNFCIAYKTLLTKHQLISVYSTAKYLKSSVGIEVSGLNVDYLGGIEQLASRAEFDEIDCVIYLRDAVSGLNEENEKAVETVLSGLAPLHVLITDSAEYLK